MQLTLAFTTLVMGVAGGPHCLAMCGAVCGGLQKGSQLNIGKFHFGRILGYALLGSVAASSLGTLAWFSNQTQVLHPLWTFFHVLVLAWGLLLLLYARQPVWADQLGKKLWSRVRQFSQLSGGGVLTGMLWALMPCGLLYSALLVAALNANPVNGALCMATFAIGSSLSLLIGPWLWFKLKQGLSWIGDSMSMRIAGLFLIAVSGWAIWMELMHQTKVWCQ